MGAHLDALDYLVAGAGAVAVYVLVHRWARGRRSWGTSPDAGE